MAQYPSAILFDLDDTLISFAGASAHAWEICCAEFVQNHDLSFSADELLKQVHRIKTWYWGDPERHKIGRHNLIKARREIVCLAFSDMKVFNIEAAHEFADYFSRRQKELVCLFPNTTDTLNIIKSKGVRMGLITNGTSAEQRDKLRRFNLEHFFEIILIEQEVGYGKPDIRVYEHALDKLRLSADDVWMVGDNLVWDIQAPQQIGIYSIWNDYKKAKLPKESSIIPDRVITEISELTIQL